MPFKKGQVTNPDGRPKGKPNRTNEQIRELVLNFIDKNIDKLQTDFEALEPKERLNFIERLFKHVLPAPLHELERLTDVQLDELITRLKSKQNE